MNLFFAAAVLVSCTAVMVAGMLLLRRRAPAGGFFSDSDRASGVFGFLGAGFAIILGFIVLVTFQGYSNAKQKAGEEAGAVSGQFEAAGEFEEDSRRDTLHALLVCYARSVTNDEWKSMANGEASAVTEGWIDSFEDEAEGTDLHSDQDLAALGAWHEADQKRAEGRRERLLESEQVLPTLLWGMLLLGAALLLGFVLLYADPEERVIAQVMLIGGVTALVVASLLVVSLLASPFQNEEGSITPSAMEYSLRLMDNDLEPGATKLIPQLCDDRGHPSSAR